MEIGFVSPSKLERIRLCESRVEAQLFDSEYEEEKGEAAASGTLAHEAAKLWYRKVDGQWMYPDGDQAFKAAMDNCASKEVTRTVNKASVKVKISELPKDAGSVQDARTSFDMIAAHYKRDVIKVLFTERRYKGHLKNGVPVHLIIDLAVDRGNGLMEIIDFKTGFLTCTTEDMWDKDQVLINLLAVRADPEFAAFPNVQFIYFWVKKGFETGPINLDAQRLGDYEHFLALKYAEILRITTPTESLNRFCKSCGRKDQCTKYREWMTEAMNLKDLLTPEQMAALDDDVIMGRYDKLGGQIKALDEIRDQLKDHLKGMLKTRQVEELEGQTFKAVVRSSKHNSYSVATVVALCQQMNKDPSSVFSVKQKEVEAVFASHPDALSQLNLTMKRGQTAPSLQVVQMGVKKVIKPRKKKDEAAAAPMPEMPIQPITGTTPVMTQTQELAL